MTVAPVNIGFRSERGPILVALMLATGLVAIDGTIIATAVPSIVRDVGNAEAFPWLFSVYLLVQAVTVPVYSKLADTIGRKPIMLIGIGLFLLGSILCGFAWSMPSLIAFRVVQGLGAGAVAPMSITIAGDIYTVQERAKAQGYLASVWGLASVVGPTLGGVFSEYVSWRWIFFVNVPLAILAMLMIARSLHEHITKVRHKVDYLGATFVTLGLTLIILAVLEGGVGWAWDSSISVGAFALGALMLAAFVFVQKRASEPVLPLWVFGRRLLVSSSFVNLGVGGVVIALSAYVPSFLQGALHVTPLVAGLTLAALTVGWPLSAAQSGRFYLRVGFRNTVLIGSVFALAGSLTLALTAGQPSLLVVAVACFIIGLGMGLIAVPSLVAAQSSVEWNQRAVVTGAQLFSRSIGSAVGVAVFGAIANGIIGEGSRTSVHLVVQSSTAVFTGVVLVIGLIVVAALAMPNTRVAASSATPTVSAEA